MNRQVYEYYLKVKDDRDALQKSWNAIGQKYTEAIAKGKCYNIREYYRKLQEDLWYTFTIYDDECRRLEEAYHIC